MLVHMICSMQDEIAGAEKKRQQTNIRFHSVEDKLEGLEKSIDGRYSLPSSFRGDWSINSDRYDVFSKEKINTQKEFIENSSNHSVPTITTIFSGIDETRLYWPKWLCFKRQSNAHDGKTPVFCFKRNPQDSTDWFTP